MIDLKTLHLHWRVSHYKGHSYRSYSLARSYRHKGTNRKDIVLKLGKLSDEEAGRWRELLQAAKTPQTFFTTLNDLRVTNHYAYLDVAVANAVWQEWQLDAVFHLLGKRVLSLATMARILTLNRCIDPAAKSKTPDWFRGTALPWLLRKCLYKINFIFFAKILDDLFHILDQMSKAGIRPKFDPFIFHKTPQYLNQIKFGRILGKVENRQPFFLPFRYLFLERFTRMDRCIIHHDNRWTLHGFAKLIETTYDHFTINRPFKSIGV